jgi:aryl-alcohol dehydrogenase-like predicted oxidoreductase
VQHRALGRTGLDVSVLGFGCGAVGGLMVQGGRVERERVVGRALELGINYFDTAPMYGDGMSEENLGAALRALRADVVVGTKFLLGGERPDVAGAVERSLEASLGRLRLDRVDLLQLHDSIGAPGTGDGVSATTVLREALPAARRLRDQGKVRFVGITGIGATRALHDVIDAGAADTVQTVFNLLNPSAARDMPQGLPGEDFERLIERAEANDTGVIVIRVLAGGALTLAEGRHPFAMPHVVPMATAPAFETDVAHAELLEEALVAGGHTNSLVEAALRFPLATEAVSTVLVGFSSLEHLEEAAAAVAKGPLPAAAMDHLAASWSRLGSRGGVAVDGPAE